MSETAEIEWRLTLCPTLVRVNQKLKFQTCRITFFWINIKYASNHIKCKYADELLICECGRLQWATDLQQDHVCVSILNL